MKTQLKQLLRLPLAMMVAVSIGSVAIPSLAFNQADLARVAPNADLENTDLSGADLRGRDLQGAILVQANLQGANLQGANLQGAILVQANLQGANLQGANLQSAILLEANLQGANLQGATIIRPLTNNPPTTVIDPFVPNEMSVSEALNARGIISPLEMIRAPNSSLPSNQDELLALIQQTKLQGATYNSSTKFPDGFNPETAEMILVP